MVLRLLIDAAHADETRVAIVENGKINDFDFASLAKKQLKGNIYLAKITRVEPSLQAAFVEYGSGKQGFLPFAEIHPDYYQIPVADREELLKEFEAAEENSAEHPSLDEPVLNEPGATAESSAPLENARPPRRRVRQTLPEPEEIFLQAEEAVMQQIETPVSPQANENAPEEVFLAAKEEVAEGIKGSTEAMAATAAPLPAISSTEEVFAPEEELSYHETGPIPEDNHTHEHEGSDPENTEIETLSNEEEMLRESRKGQSFFRRYKIQEVIKRNQIVLVQVIKEERGNKGVSLTTFISLAGRYCVLMPNSLKGGGISRKISGGEDRRRLREISAELKTTRGMSAIIRTAGIDRSRAEIQRDYDYLLKLWDNIREQTLASTAPALIYEESDIIKRTIRDLYTSEMEEIVIAGEAAFEETRNFMGLILPANNTAVKLHKDNLPLFHAYNIEDQLNSMYDHVVKLRSGGYIVINPTEALISIDVNSGKATGERNIEETASKTNQEAAHEIARQLRLRDLAGLIVIDFIDMGDSRNRRMIERSIKDALKMDRAKIQIGRISPFGLLEMSRQRLRPSISETSTVTCTHCFGRGIIRSNTSVALQIIRALEKEAAANNIGELKLFVATAILLVLLNTRREEISRIESKYFIRIIAVPEEGAVHGNYRIERIKGSRRPALPGANFREPVSMENTMMEAPLLLEEEIAEPAELNGALPDESQALRGDRPRRNRRGGRNRRNKTSNNESPLEKEFSDTDLPDSEAALIAPDQETIEENKEERPAGEGKSGRSRRSRKWRDQHSRGNSENAVNPDSPAIETAYSSRADEAVDSPSVAPRFVPAPERQLEYAEGNGSAPSHSFSSPPPLEDQSPKDSKPKKGWWRRIVEA